MMKININCKCYSCVYLDTLTVKCVLHGTEKKKCKEFKEEMFRGS